MEARPPRSNRIDDAGLGRSGCRVGALVAVSGCVGGWPTAPLRMGLVAPFASSPCHGTDALPTDHRAPEPCSGNRTTHLGRRGQDLTQPARTEAGPAFLGCDRCRPAEPRVGVRGICAHPDLGADGDVDTAADQLINGVRPIALPVDPTSPRFGPRPTATDRLVHCERRRH
jgi:hypothetical protein